MSNQKRALVVDDSRSARLVLRRMLEKYGLRVDTVESANQALDFLIHNRPDVIFMDHMMPGMDGFEAVKAIKNNPETATIPVMMYTSKGGDLYLGQARALGAVGVLPKTVAPAELFKSLLKIGLVTERRHATQELSEEDASERAEDLHKPVPPPLPAHVAATGLSSAGTPDRAEPDLHLRRLLEEQSVELRKDILLSLETVARQTGNRLNRELDEKLEQLDRQPPARPPSILPVVLLTGLLFVSLAWNVSLHNRDDAQPVVTTSSNAALAANRQVTETLDTLEALQAETVTLLNRAWQTTGWAINQELEYPYDEIALDGRRADTVERLLERLSAAGYRGNIILETHVGEFCLLGDQQSGFRLPPPDLTVDQCAFIGNPVQPTDSAAAHQSLRFANFFSSTPLLNNSLTMKVIAATRDTPLLDYPERSAATSAQDWNRVAARNNRVVIHLEPQE